MVVKYIKIIVATLTLVVVGLVTNNNIYEIKAVSQGETWIINENPEFTYYSWGIPFTSNNEDFNYIEFETMGEGFGLLYYYNGNPITVYSFGSWDNEAYRTITFEIAITEGPLFDWLEENAVKQIISYTQEDLDNAWADGYDVGISTVHENGFAGIYNPFTGQFYNNENSFSYTHGWYGGYDFGYEEAEDGFDYEAYYSMGIKMAYMNGFGGYINPLTNEYYDITNSFSYKKGFDEAISGDFTFTALLFQIFDGVGSVLSIELLPNITLGAIVAVPIVFGIIYFILGKRKGD